MSLLHILTYFCSSHTLSPTAAFAFNNEKEDEGGGGLKKDLLSILSRKFLCLSLYSGSNFFQFLLSTMSSDAPQNYGSLSRRLIFHPSILSWACFAFVLVFFKLSIISVLPSCRQSLAADPLPPPCLGQFMWKKTCSRSRVLAGQLTR